MSGIAAEISSRGSSDSLASVSQMLLRMRARGPDGARAVRLDAPFARGALGYASLIVTHEDASVDQPLRLPTGTVIAFHGRLDNREELLAEVTLGPEARSDAHLVGALFDRFGTTMAPRLLGDFAFVVFSPRTSEVFAARDHMGICPLFYWWSPDGRCRIASEKRALFADGAFAPKVNRAELASGIVEEYIERDETLFEGIRAIPPGSSLTWRGTAPQIDTYWRVDPWKRVPITDVDEAAAVLFETFEEAVRCRLRARDPVATGVSGGLDSSSIAAMIAHIARRDALPAPALVFARYDDAACDELSFSQRVADHLGLPLRVFTPPRAPGTFGPTRDLELLFDPYFEMLGGLAALLRPTGARAYFGGAGSDELQQPTGHESDQALHEGDLANAARWSGLVDAPLAWGSWRRLIGTFKRRIYVRKRRLPLGIRDWVPPFLTPEAVALVEVGWSRRVLDLARYRREGASREIALGWLGYSLNSPYSISQTSQALANLGLELRVPFYDRRLVELLVGLPTSVTSSSEITKPLLRKAIEPLLPPSIAYRSFACLFVSFFHDVVRREAPLYRALFAESRLESMGLVEPGTLVRALDEGMHDADRTRDILAYVTYEGWLRGLEDARPEPSFNPEEHLNQTRDVCIVW